VLDDVRSYLTQFGGVSFFKTEKGTEAYELLGEHGEDLDALHERLAIGSVGGVSSSLRSTPLTRPSLRYGEPLRACVMYQRTTEARALVAKSGSQTKRIEPASKTGGRSSIPHGSGSSPPPTGLRALA